MLKSTIRRFTPKFILKMYHYALAQMAAFVYGHPSNKLIVIGVTGTNGKSSTVQILGRILEHAGHKVGWTSTAGFKIADKEMVNDKKMTMLGRTQTQRMIKDMVKAGCEYAIIETSSEGIEQYRHVGVNYDLVVFTNLTPEHIESHGSFEKYKQAKGKLFAHAASGKIKTFNGKKIEKQSVVNADDPYADFFLAFPIKKKLGYGIETKLPPPLTPPRAGGESSLVAHDVKLSSNQSSFVIDGRTFVFSLLGRFNCYNILAAISSARALGFDLAIIQDAVARLDPIPGRMEHIDEGQSFSVIVDYAYEPAALDAVYETIKVFDCKRIIHVVGSAGGGRDQARRAILGRMSAQHDDIVIVANEDPYDEDPSKIIDEVAQAAIDAGKIESKDIFKILDRQEAIDKAVALAQAGDLVLITGKGSEPVMAVANGQKVPWDDRVAARIALKKLV